MKLGEFIQKTRIDDQSSRARYPDETSVQDIFLLHIHMRGHGPLYEAEIEKIDIGRSNGFIQVRGTDKEGA